MIEIRIQEKIFEEYPTFRRGIVIAKKLENHGLSQKLEDLLNQTIVKAAEQPIDLKADPRTLA